MTEARPADRLKDLLDRLEAARRRLEGTESPDDAVEILTELAELARETQTTVERARRQGERKGAGNPQA